MDAIFHAFLIWCCQFVVVSTVFLTTAYWLLGRARQRTMERVRSSNQAALSATQESHHVAHGS